MSGLLAAGVTFGLAHGDDQHGDTTVHPERGAPRPLLLPVGHWLLVCLSLVGACAGSPGTFQVAQGGSPGATENPVDFAREFKLRNGEAAHVGNDGLVIRFERVTEDARCPVGNTCVSDGDAVVLVTLRERLDVPASLELHTNPSSTSEGKYLGYRVRLVRLEPRPVGEQRVPLPQYWATFMVSR